MNITWKIKDINTFNEGELTGIVHSIKFICTCETDTMSNSVDSSVVLPKPTESESFIALEDVTEDLAYEWLFKFLGEENKQLIETQCAKPLLESSHKQIKPTWLNAQ